MKTNMMLFKAWKIKLLKYIVFKRKMNKTFKNSTELGVILLGRQKLGGSPAT
jgi:hypothetical protein